MKRLVESIAKLPRRTDHSHDGPAEFVLLSDVLACFEKHGVIANLLDTRPAPTDAQLLDWLEAHPAKINWQESGQGDIYWCWFDGFGEKAPAPNLRSAITLARASE